MNIGINYNAQLQRFLHCITFRQLRLQRSCGKNFKCKASNIHYRVNADITAIQSRVRVVLIDSLRHGRPIPVPLETRAADLSSP